MGVRELTVFLRSKVSEDTRVLTDPHQHEYRIALERWSNLDLKTPFAIIQPVNEADILLIVKEALRTLVPFTPVSGGHSLWSTIDQDGFILDLSRYKEVLVDSSRQAVTIKGGVLMGEMQLELFSKGQFTAVSNGNTVGVIPYFVNGGISLYGPIVGFGCENIISARVITANGDVSEASETNEPDLLFALRGAGQFFGVVVELVIRTYPLSAINGTPHGSHQRGTCVFLPHQVRDVCQILNNIIADENHITAGHLMILNAPPEFKEQVLMVSTHYLGSDEQAKKAFQPLLDLQPLQQTLEAVTFDKHSDQLDFVCAKGDFKRFSQIGLPNLNQDNFVKLVELHAKLLLTNPTSKRSGFTFEWHSPTQSQQPDTSFGNTGTRFWFNVLSWYEDPTEHAEMARVDLEAQELMRLGSGNEEFVTYANASREDPLEWRYQGAERLARLKDLKRKWDSSGVFTHEFL